MTKKQENALITKFVNQAHKIFNATSVFEVIDTDRQSATEFLNKYYRYPGTRKIDQYLKVVAKLKQVTG